MLLPLIQLILQLRCTHRPPSASYLGKVWPMFKSPFLCCAHAPEMPSALCAIELDHQIEQKEILRTPLLFPILWGGEGRRGERYANIYFSFPKHKTSFSSGLYPD